VLRKPKPSYKYTLAAIVALRFVRMGTWGTDIKQNDTSAEIYADYYEQFNNGIKPADISEKLIKDYKEIIDNVQDSNNFWLSLALAQWETNSLSLDVVDRVTTIIKGGFDLEVWRELEATDEDVIKRKVVLEDFLEKILTRSPPSITRTEVPVKPIFSRGDCLVFQLHSGNYGGIVILDERHDPEWNSNLVALTRLNQIQKPTVADFEKSELLLKSFVKWKNNKEIYWLATEHFYEVAKDSFEIIGRLSIKRKYSPDEIRGFSMDWTLPIRNANAQFEFELKNSKPMETLSILSLIE
jgi:hypothetical protein